VPTPAHMSCPYEGDLPKPPSTVSSSLPVCFSEATLPMGILAAPRNPLLAYWIDQGLVRPAVALQVVCSKWLFLCASG
jgi:hypothetical protein